MPEARIEDKCNALSLGSAAPFSPIAQPPPVGTRPTLGDFYAAARRRLDPILTAFRSSVDANQYGNAIA